ncbi:MAG: hypothetical protein GTN86_01320, partial [Xanthomonadales bacterium]|uniref:hypothetical protein n=1 Tax=Hydrogenophaga sp. TaxID=1904254 RepID=UPI00168F2922
VARVLNAPDPVPPWGEVNAVTLANLFFGGKLPPWLRMDHGPYALPGNHATINQGNLFRIGGRLTSFAPCYRMVAD